MPNFDVTQLALIFFPGIIANILLSRLLYYKKQNTFIFAIHSFVLGTMSYIILYGIKYLLGKVGIVNFEDISNLRFLSIIDRKNGIDMVEVLFASFLAVPMALLISCLETNRCISRLSRFIKVSNRFSEPDVWGYALNSDIIHKNPWINLRSKNKNIMYQGIIRAFSDSYKEAEILLDDVSVYKNDSGEFLYQVDFLYITLEHSDIEIEFFKGVNKSE